MDLSNKDEAKYWFSQARLVDDKELRKVALRACERYHKLARIQEKSETKRLKPGYGFRPLLGFFCALALLVLWCLLAFAKEFSIGALLTAGGILIGIMVVGSAFASHSTGRLSDDSLIKLIQLAIQKVTPRRGTSRELPTIHSGAGSNEEMQSQLPAPTENPASPPPRVDFD
jgi:hypothetical protein